VGELSNEVSGNTNSVEEISDIFIRIVITLTDTGVGKGVLGFG